MENGNKPLRLEHPVHGRALHEIPAFQDRLDDQAARTRGLRRPLHERAGIGPGRRVLDVGCGSGSVTQELLDLGAAVVAVDVDPSMVRRSRRLAAPVLVADGRRLPFPDGSFDVVVCNLTIMWCPDPGRLVSEMARVVRPGGVVLATMEPDYGGKVHHPENPLIDLVFKGEGIRRRGGDPHAGRRLRDHFVRAGLRTDVGIGNLEVLTPDQDLALWGRNRAFYRRMLKEAGFDRISIDAWEQEYLAALDAGVQLSWFPFFHAIGRRPDGPLDAA